MQSKSKLIQLVTWDTGDAFTGVGGIIRETFLLLIIFENAKTLSPIMVYLSKIPVKKSGLGILNMVKPAQEKNLFSHWGSSELVRDVTVNGELSNADHLQALNEERRDGQKDREALYESKLKGLVMNLKDTDMHLILRAKITGAWLSLRGTTV